MAKKNFEDVNTNALFETMDEAMQAPERKERRQPGQHEMQTAKENLRTVGLKGAKLPRINMAFTPSNYDYISAMAKLCGMTLTQFVNEALERDRLRNQDTYDKVRDFRASLK